MSAYPPMRGRGGGPNRGGFPHQPQPQGYNNPGPQYDGQYDDGGYSAPPMRGGGAMRGGRGGSPMPMGRGGPGPGPQRGYPPPQANGGYGRGGFQGNSRPYPGGRGMPPQQMGPPQQGYPQQGYQQDLAGQMGNMSLGPRRPPPVRPGLMANQNGPGPGPGPGGMQRPPPGDYGYNDPQDGGFGPPRRSETVPVNRMPMRPPMPSQPQSGGAGYNRPVGGDMAPPRPSTAQGNRMYQQGNGPPPPDQYEGSVSRHSAEPAYGDFYSDYYDDDTGNNRGQSGQYPPPPGQTESYNSQGNGSQNYDSQGYDYGSRGYENQGYDSQGYNSQAPDPYPQARQTDPPELAAQRGPGRVAELNRAKSQPDLRNSQTAVFEMAGDIPPMPLARIPPQQRDGMSPGGYDQSPMSQQGYQESPVGQQGPPPPGPGLPPHPAPYRSNTLTSQGYGSERSNTLTSQSDNLPSHPAPYRSNTVTSQSYGSERSNTLTSQSDSLKSHPAPVRPGHMPNSLVNLSDRPPPVRNYSGSTLATSSASSIAAPPAQSQIGATPPPPKPVEAPVTVEELEHLKAIIKQDSGDQVSALRLAKKLVEAADVLVPNIPDQKARSRSRDHYLADANKILRKLEKANNPDAMFFFADCLGRGLFSSEPDNAHAFSLYQSAAKLGHAAAAYRTAVCCEIGNDEGGGTRKDPLKAIQWYKRAATLGDTPAMYKVGMILLKGLLGQPVNPREAVSWLKRAAERADAENPHALHELALLYEDVKRNDIVIPDQVYALQLFTQAAQLGYKFSQFRLGWAYEFGLMGCPINPAESIKWYSLAAQQEEHQSELALSGWYLTGSEGVMAPNDTEAYLWARKAAVAGLAKAEYAMGYYTQKGIGVAPNIEDAKRWYWRAAAQDYPKARQQLEILKRTGGKGAQNRERISRSKIAKQGEGECSVM